MQSAASFDIRTRSGKRSWTTLLGWAMAVVVLGWAWQGAEMAPSLLFQNAGNMATLAADFVPPTFGRLDHYIDQMLVTLQIAIWGTLLAVLFAIPFGLLSSENLAPWWINQPVRRLMDACRAINELVFAMLFVVAVGLGPFAGTLALFVHTTGVLAKLFSEAVEATDAGPMEGVRVTGAGRLEEIVFGLIPRYCRCGSRSASTASNPTSAPPRCSAWSAAAVSGCRCGRPCVVSSTPRPPRSCW
nr:phosphate/phosphonate ABC transporter permease [Salinicola acroporae]